VRDACPFFLLSFLFVFTIVPAMKQAIVGFHQDDAGDWVARLACGHNQHVRHNPPWQNRPWVINSQARKQHLGNRLECVKCDMNAPRDWELSESYPDAD
jgi:hypothetical protein